MFPSLLRPSYATLNSLRRAGNSVSVLCGGLKATLPHTVGCFLGIAVLLEFLLSLLEAVELLKAHSG